MLTFETSSVQGTAGIVDKLTVRAPSIPPGLELLHPRNARDVLKSLTH